MNVEAQVSSLLNHSAEVNLKGGYSSEAWTHLQGMAALDNGCWVLAQDVKGDGTGELVCVDPAARTRVHIETMSFPGKSGFPSGLQGCGNLLVATTARNKQLRFYDYNDPSKPVYLSHLTVDVNQTVENVGLVWHPVARRYYLFCKANHESARMWVSSSSDLLRASTRFEGGRDLLGATVPFGEAGAALIYEVTTGSLYCLSFGAAPTGETDEENDFAVSRITSDKPLSTMTSRDTMTVSDVGYYKLTDGSGSFRWGGTAWVTPSGRIQVIATPRDYKLLGSSDFGTWTSSISDTAADTYRLTIERIYCHETDEGGEDELYLKFSDGSRYPTSGAHSMNEDDSRLENWYVNHSIRFSGAAMRCTLMEDDNIGDDNLGSFTVPADERSGIEPLSGSDGYYVVYWRVERETSGATITQVNTGRFLDAHETSSANYRVVTREAQRNKSQEWLLTDDGHGDHGETLYNIRQCNTGRYLDAYEVAADDYKAVTRTAQGNDSQRWLLRPDGDSYTIRQVVTDRYLDAYESKAQDYQVVTRTAQGNDSQRWRVRFEP